MAGCDQLYGLPRNDFESLLMSYGFKTTTDGRTVQIDDEHPVLQFSGSGKIIAGSDHVFQEAIKTTEPPWLFIRPADGSPFFMGMRFLGGPGNWYGVRIHSVSSQYHNHGGAGRNHGAWSYILGKWATDYSKDAYGMRVWDEGGRLLYDAGSRYIKLSFQFTRWRYGYRHSSGGWTYVMHYLDLPQSASMSDASNYLLINPFVTESTIEPSFLIARRKIKIIGNQLLSVTQTSWKGGGDLIQPGIIGQASN